MTSNDNYRYDKVTMGVLMRDFVFDKNAPKADDVIPAFELVDADGARVTNVDLFGGRPTLLVFGSKSCPMTVSSVDPQKALYDEFGDTVQFVTVNVREAHPAERIRQPKSIAEKIEHATELKAELDIPWTVLTDDLDGSFHRAMDPKPNSAYVVGPAGRILFRSLWAGDVGSLRRALQEITTGRTPVKKQSTRTFAPLMRGLGFFHETLAKAGPQATRDMVFAAPPMSLLGRLAKVFQGLKPEHRGLSALLTVVATISVVGGIAGVAFS